MEPKKFQAVWNPRTGKKHILNDRLGLLDGRTLCGAEIKAPRVVPGHLRHISCAKCVEVYEDEAAAHSHT